MTLDRLWWTHARWGCALLTGALLMSSTQLDISVAQHVFYRAGHWIGADLWLTNEGLHEGGRWLVRVLVAGLLVGWSFSYLGKTSSPHRRSTSYALLSVLLSIGLIALLKSTTNVACPWDLSLFGGARPHLGLFEARPRGWKHAACFPAAHAGSAYAWVALYFVANELKRQWARPVLIIVLTIGVMFGLAQQSRGAHFLSHDLISAALSWLVASTLYVFVFRATLKHDPRVTSTREALSLRNIERVEYAHPSSCQPQQDFVSPCLHVTGNGTTHNEPVGCGQACSARTTESFPPRA